MLEMTMIQKLIIWILPVLFAITVHEVAHGWVASKLGDPTAKMLGRLTLNPLKHIDIIGTVLVPLVLFFISNFIFGWARPVPVNFQNLRRPRRDSALVAASGPISNLLMAIIWAAIMKIGFIAINNGWHFALPIMLMGEAGIIINLILMVLNLIPIPPLDGGRIVSSLLPAKLAYYYDRIEPYGFFILLLLLFSGVLRFVIGPPIYGLQHLMMIIFGLPI